MNNYFKKDTLSNIPLSKSKIILSYTALYCTKLRLYELWIINHVAPLNQCCFNPLMILRAMVLSCKMFLRIQMLSLSHLLSEMNTLNCPQLDVLLNTSDTQRHSFSFSFTLFIFLSVYKVPQVCRRLSEALDTMVKQIQFHFSTSNTNIFV